MNRFTNKDFVFYTYICIHILIATIFSFGFNGVFVKLVETFSTPILLIVMAILIMMKYTKINDWFEKDFEIRKKK